MNGNVYQFGDPIFSALNYQYSFQSKRIMAIAKLLYSTIGKLHPYISGGAGVAFNRSYGYQEIPLAEFAEPMPPFANRSYHSFAYQAGLGIDAELTDCIRVAFEYRC